MTLHDLFTRQAPTLLDPCWVCVYPIKSDGPMCPTCTARVVAVATAQGHLTDTSECLPSRSRIDRVRPVRARNDTTRPALLRWIPGSWVTP